MRLSEQQIQIIKQSVRQIFSEKAVVYVFGSRVDSAKRGGDIDLYVETPEQRDLLQKKVRFIRMLWQQLGEQKIDVIINNFTRENDIYETAKKEGIAL